LAAVAQAAELRFTRSDYDALPEDLRVELIDGELLKMAPPTIRHQKILLRIAKALSDRLGLDRVFVHPVDVPVDRFNALEPDVVVVPEDAIPKDTDKGIRAPMVVVEILSPSTASRDRDVKAGLYFLAGAREVWLVDGDANSVEVRIPQGASTHTETLESDALAGFRLALKDVFRAG
jgi:Uma2 family endonuclease